jgi:hypothetical protein
MGTGVEVQQVSAFVDVDQRDDVWPSIPVNRAYMSDPLLAQKLSCRRIRHEPFVPKDLPTHVRNRV